MMVISTVYAKQNLDTSWDTVGYHMKVFQRLGDKKMYTLFFNRILKLKKRFKEKMQIKTRLKLD